MDVGTSNPIVARLLLELDDLIRMARIPEEQKQIIRECCHEIMRSLIQAEKAAKPLIEEIKAIEKKIIAEGIQTQDNGQAIQTPGVVYLDNSRTFLKFCKQALQSLAKAQGILLEKEFDGPHFDKILARAKERLGKDNTITKLLEEDKKWLEEINFLRRKDEHPDRNTTPFVKGFSISKSSDGKFVVDQPRFFNNAPILNRLETYSQNLLTFSEELIAYTLEDFLPEMVRLYEIPEEQRDPSAPIRYKLGLQENFQFPIEHTTELKK